MTNKRQALLAIDKALASLSNAEKLEILEQKRYEVSQALNIHESKMTNGTQGERVACEHLGLEWNSSSMNGCDAWDENGKGVELKCFKTSAKRANVQYKFPVRKKVETDAVYAARVSGHYAESSPGGHYWVLLSNGSTRYKQHWFVDSARFAEAIQGLLLAEPSKATMNFGCQYCKDCGIPHRIDWLSKMFNNKAIPIRFPKTIASRCFNQEVKIKY